MKKWTIILLTLPIVYDLFAQPSIVTQHADAGRTGWYNHEHKLTTSNVKPGSFGLLFSRPVDDQIYAQPLLMRHVNIPGKGNPNVVFVATVNNSIYAFDADSARVTSPYWQLNLSPSGARAVKNTDMNPYCGAYNDFSGNMGIVGTPVIDTLANTIYVVVKSYSPTNGFEQYLHALDVRTGAERASSPIKIAAQVTGSGSGSVGGIINFDALKQNQRSGLLLLNGIVYIAWASHGDCDPYHGWIIGYDAATLQQKIVYNTTPEGYKGGIWMSAAGIAADDSGNLYVGVGNGSVGVGADPTNLTNRSESALRLTPNGATLQVTSYFTPSDYQYLENIDGDFGVTGVLLIPGTNRAFAGAKDGKIYLMDRDNMSGYQTVDHVLQVFDQFNSNAHNLTSLTYYGGTSAAFVYVWSDNTPLKAIPFNRASNLLDLGNIKTSALQGPVGYNGAFLSVSSNGTDDSSAILWTAYAASGNANQQTRPGILRALSAADVTKELWNSSMSAADNPGNYAKFNCPVISNGKVYLASFSNKLNVYGLMDPITGVKKEETNSLKIVPNPASSHVTIFTGNKTISSIRIYNMAGMIGYSAQSNATEFAFSVSGLAAGLYFVEVITDDDILKGKMVVR
ncbi:MAG: T9SS type A sorting domain-containing protein [Bacteroidetes bacterium]|nr:T9SS type A sorting domain-containing protein [Bacteroidota bacterium]